MLVKFRVRLFSVLYASYGSRPSTRRLLREAEVNVTWTYPLWLLVPTVSGVRYRSEGQNRNSGKSFLEENHR